MRSRARFYCSFNRAVKLAGQESLPDLMAMPVFDEGVAGNRVLSPVQRKLPPLTY